MTTRPPCPLCDLPSRIWARDDAFLHCGNCEFSFFPKDRPEADYPKDYYHRGISSILSLAVRPLLLLDTLDLGSALRGRGRLLEVGCGAGERARAVSSPGRSVLAIDTSEAAVLEARKKPGLAAFRHAAVEDLPTADSFDAIYSCHVIEHVEETIPFLVACRKRLSPGGSIVLRLPDAFGMEARLAGRRWIHHDAPFHRRHFSRKAIRLALEKAGFRNVRVRATLVEYKQTLLYALASALHLPTGRVARLLALPAQALFMPLSAALSLFGIGGTIQVTAENPSSSTTA